MYRRFKATIPWTIHHFNLTCIPILFQLLGVMINLNRFLPTHDTRSQCRNGMSVLFIFSHEIIQNNCLFLTRSHNQSKSIHILKCIALTYRYYLYLFIFTVIYIGIVDHSQFFNTTSYCTVDHVSKQQRACASRLSFFPRPSQWAKGE